jgi:hypothetical protein
LYNLGRFRFHVLLLLLWSFFVFDYDCNFRRRSAGATSIAEGRSVTWPGQRIGQHNKVLFGLWTFQVLATGYIVHTHMKVAHHPKFYVGYNESVTIVAHIVGTTR